MTKPAAAKLRLLLDTAVTYLKGVGPARAEALQRLGVSTAGDLLFHIPHRYEDASTISPISSLETGMQATIIGRVISKGIIPTRRGLRIFQAVLKDDSGMIEAGWPGQPYLDRTIQKGDVLLLSGTVRFFHGRQLQPREFINLGEDDEGTGQGRVLAAYPATEGLSFKVIRSIIDQHLDGLLALVEEYLPASVLSRAAVPSIRDALRMVHRPASLAEAQEGRARLAFEELFFVHVLHQRAKALAREVRRGIRFEQLLHPLDVMPQLVTGSMSARDRRSAASRLESVEPLLVVGTHALVQEGTSFGKLGIAIVDEQHRFGVEHRKQLGAKGEAPDILLMSATPIPRSLALTLYGDLDLSVLDERPPGRRPVTTGLRGESGRDRVMAFLNRQLELGRQAYIVYPVIEESEKTDLKAATTMFEALTKDRGALAGRAVALLHGRVPADQRDDIMRRFRDGKVQVLVATTVIEVGIDVPNATVMIIEHPERFGLSQLHQLRGRVGRGAEESFCILLGDLSPESRDRLELFVRTDDGFEIARADLRLRGMGDLFGERQSGVPTFRVADPVRDAELNERARDIAEELLTADPDLTRKEHATLRKVLNHRYRRSLELFRVG